MKTKKKKKKSKDAVKYSISKDNLQILWKELKAHF